ncbi:MAG: anti-sigma factor [Acidobacteria bacterium]|nr:anti-sigma factor [Acidobacteriota bacterium]
MKGLGLLKRIKKRLKTACEVLKGHDEYRDILALAALDAADGAELRDLEAHLASCAECRAELRELRGASSALAFAAAPAAPSPELRTRLLASLKSTPQEPARAASTGSDAGRASNRASSPAASVVSLEDARRATRRAYVSRRAFNFTAVAASLLVVSLAAVSLVLWRRNAALNSAVASLSNALERARGDLGQTRNELASARRERELFASPEMRTAQLAGTKMAESARARLVYDERTGEAMFTAAKLPPAPAGKAYQLWYIADGKPMPGSVFTTDAEGRAEMRASIPREGLRAQVFAVTLEPAGGLPAPSGEVYLKGAS